MSARTAGRHAVRTPLLAAAGLLTCLCACSDATSAPSSPMTRDEASRAGVVTGEDTRASPDGRHETLVAVLGDSLAAGFRLPGDQAFPMVLEDLLRTEGRRVRMLNAGVSGDTSAGGLRRLDWLLAQGPDVLLVELGGNDGLRGLPVEETRRNLERIVTTAQDAGVAVVLLGMRMPPNLGPAYTREFADVYPELADEHDVPLVPFLLEGVAGRPDLNLGDGIHPNRQGQEILARNVLPVLREVLEGLQQ